MFIRGCRRAVSENVKALFRRAKAHVGAWNTREARQDFERVAELDPALSKAAHKELQHLDELEQEKKNQDRALLEGKMFS